MATEQKIELSWLIPDFNQLTLIPTTGDELSTLFVFGLIVVTIIFSGFFAIKCVSTWFKLSWLEKVLKPLNRKDIVEQREPLLLKAKSKEKSIGFLWMEFDETLVEICRNGRIEIRNTLDAGHFFNPYTLAGSVTENRLIAAVPGFLTALGVIGTFMGLQLGLADLKLGAGVDVNEMQEGVAAVVNGAKIAFLTSVWGVALSVIFNFFEKLCEQLIRRKIRNIEFLVDWLFPRIRPEEQLQIISDNSSESREVLQGLAEKIGEKMQEALVSATQGIQTSLEQSLSEIMAPAINKLVDSTTEGNQKALEGLLQSFMEGFGQAGNQQRDALDDVSERVNKSVEAMQATMSSFVEQLQNSQAASGDREKALIADIANQVNSLSTQSQSIHQKLTSFVEGQISEMTSQMQSREAASAKRDEELVKTIKVQVDELILNSRSQGERLSSFVESQLGGLVQSFDDREMRASELETARNERIEQQSNSIAQLSTEILSSVEKSVSQQVKAVEQLLVQGQKLQNSINSSVEASAQATQAMKESSTELRVSADSMKVLSSHINEAGNKLSGAIRNAVESTSDLASQNQLTAQRMEKLRDELIRDVSRFGELTAQLNGLISSASSTFSELKGSHKEFIGDLKVEVEGLNQRMTGLLKDYAEQANGQTAAHLNVWSSSVTAYSTQMNNAVKALSSVVDEIQAKLG
ncbi:anti-phage ZorAB system protein ZorA [Shewanella sp. S23-S33]|uniref:anti-phage ZorAB system protein ZorA n=1 Tax=Shewanella sp. S23-S33 TaxID=3342769 RepID=UPI00372D7D2F